MNTVSKEGWIEATLEFINAGEDSLGSFIAECVDQGAVGSMEQSTSPDETNTGHVECEECGKFSRILVYFPEHAGLENVLNLLEEKTRLARAGSTASSTRLLRVRRIEREDWATNWMHSFPPEKVSDRFWIVPPWNRSTLPSDAVPIVMEPGLAFGTGKHVTTQFCLGFMEELARDRGVLCPSFLDAGCGSAILSLAARKLGAQRVLGVDDDPDAIRVALRNLELNSLADQIRLVNGPLECCRGPYELIAANLTADILTRYADLLRVLLSAHGHCILSGVLDMEKQELLQRYQGAGFRILAEKNDREEGWTALLITKSPDS